MKMKKYLMISNLLYYAGIYALLILYKQNRSDISVALCIIPILVGIIGTATPESMVNVGVLKTGKKYIYMGLIVKEIVFILALTMLDISFSVAFLLISILLLFDVYLQMHIGKIIAIQNINMQEYLDSLNDFDSGQIRGECKYLWINILLISLFLNVHENQLEMCISLPACLLYFLFLCVRWFKNPVISKQNIIVQIILETGMLVTAFFKLNIPMCVLFGYQYMLIRDSFIPKAGE